MHFFPAVIEDEAVPVGVKALARVGVLVEVGAVEEAQAVLVGGKVRGHPVQDHADAVLVQGVDEVHEILRRAVVARRRKVSRDLVSPGAEEGVLHDRQEFDVGEAHLPNIVGELRGHLPIGEGAVALFGHPSPRAQVDFVDGHRFVQAAAFMTRLHPFGISPLVIQIPHDRRGFRRDFVEDRERIGLVHLIAIEAREDVVLVESSFGHLGKKTFPDAGLPLGAERVAPFVPAIEVSHDGDLLGIGRPHGEIGAASTAGLDGMGPQLFVEAKMTSLVEEIEIVVGDQADRLLAVSQIGLPPSLPHFGDGFEYVHHRFNLAKLLD